MSERDLAYLIAVGHRRYRYAARAAIESLRHIGRFDGEIVLLSDRPLTLPRVNTIILDECDLPKQPKRLKLMIGRYVDLNRYRRVLFLDADLATSMPLMPIIANSVDAGALVCTDDFGQTVDQGFNRRLLDETEIKQHASVSLGANSGFFAARGNVLGHWLQQWAAVLDENHDRPGDGYDQPGLNAMMLRGQLPVYMIRGLMWFPRFDPERKKCRSDAPFAHFHGAGRKWRRGWRMHRFVKRTLKRQYHGAAPDPQD